MAGHSSQGPVVSGPKKPCGGGGVGELDYGAPCQAGLRPAAAHSTSRRMRRSSRGRSICSCLWRAGRKLKQEQYVPGPRCTARLTGMQLHSSPSAEVNSPWRICMLSGQRPCARAAAERSVSGAGKRRPILAALEGEYLKLYVCTRRIKLNFRSLTKPLKSAISPSRFGTMHLRETAHGVQHVRAREEQARTFLKAVEKGQGG